MLDRIIKDTLEELRHRQEIVPLSVLEKAIAKKQAPLDFAAAIGGDSLSLIAEVKRASPSKGVLRADLEPAGLASLYARCGAAAISVLTEARHFRGSLEDFEAVRLKLPGTPLLRKDFILTPYQILESRACGADALLLIAAVLDDAGLKGLLSLSHDMGMKCLVEVHNGQELDRALACSAGIIGINNRNLTNMTVDINTTGRLRPLVPPGKIVVSESGIKGQDDMWRMRAWGVNAVLVGEALVTAGDIPAKIKELLDQD